ncbi:MAG TPA: succinate dehydrogenase cytochrome b subunit [Gemmatimonadaceae bacterium]|nr:succinate dehydrogenase cytochrome b subunit [Gemmatimonadaceae bacterium]
MHRLVVFWRSTIGKKVVMAVTGIIGIGFVLAHIAGNLLIFRGAEALNGYSHMLHGPAAELLWVARVVLLGSVILHITAAYQLTQVSHAARPHDYAKRESQVSTYASRLMRWGGVLLLVFIIFHILHFTTGTIRPGVFVAGDVYTNVVSSFRIWWVSLFYMVSIVFLGLHLYHGAWSSVRTIGAASRSPNPLHRRIAMGIAVIVWLGFTIVPFAVWTGMVG